MTCSLTLTHLIHSGLVTSLVDQMIKLISEEDHMFFTLPTSYLLWRLLIKVPLKIKWLRWWMPSSNYLMLWESTNITMPLLVLVNKLLLMTMLGESSRVWMLLTRSMLKRFKNKQWRFKVWTNKNHGNGATEKTQLILTAPLLTMINQRQTLL